VHNGEPWTTAVAEGGYETLDGGGGGVVKVMEVGEILVTAVVGVVMCRCGRRTGQRWWRTASGGFQRTAGVSNVEAI
jgi:hypothetical protein